MNYRIRKRFPVAVQSDEQSHGGSTRSRYARALRTAFHPQTIHRGLDPSAVIPDTLGQDSTVWARYVNAGVDAAVSGQSMLLEGIVSAQQHDPNAFHDRL